jgi:hypothetical protein
VYGWITGAIRGPDQERSEKQRFSMREALDTAGPLGRALIFIVGAIGELERSLIRERVRAGMRRARLEGDPAVLVSNSTAKRSSEIAIAVLALPNLPSRIERRELQAAAF